MSKNNNKQGNAGEQEMPETAAPDSGGKTPEAAAPAAESAQGNQPADGEAAASGGEETERVRELEAKLAELNDTYLRKAADFENFRKRMHREKQELTDFANQNLLLDIIPALDDFERAIKSAETVRDFTSFYEGIIMVEKQLSSQLENKWGLKRFDSEGEAFDPNRHEAIQMEKTAGIAAAQVKEDYVKGYSLKEKVIRYAKVKVLVPADGESAPAPETQP